MEKEVGGCGGRATVCVIPALQSLLESQRRVRKQSLQPTVTRRGLMRIVCVLMCVSVCVFAHWVGVIACLRDIIVRLIRASGVFCSSDYCDDISGGLHLSLTLRTAVATPKNHVVIIFAVPHEDAGLCTPHLVLDPCVNPLVLDRCVKLFCSRQVATQRCVQL